jgi:hypothetical protein
MQTVTFGAVGDIVLSGTTANEMRQRGTAWPLQEVLPILRRADVLFGNLECVILPPEFPGDQFDPRAMTSTFDGTPALVDAGFDVVNLANNHILDGGTSGMFHTRDLVEASGIMAVGVGADQNEARRLHILERSGLRWGFLCYAEDSNYTLSTNGPCHAYYEPTVVLEDIAGARSQVDVLVVSIHADLEFVETPSIRRREAFRKFAHAGATLVLGHHPHVPQGVERIGASLVVYSLGNFVSHAYTSAYLRSQLPNTARTFVLLADVSREGVHCFKRVPVQIAPPPSQRPGAADGADAKALTAYFNELDRMVADDAIVAANWRAVAVRKLMTTLQHAAERGEPQDALHLVGELLYVAENRAWIDEVEAAAAEIWAEQRSHVDLHHRPSFASSRPRPPDRGIVPRAIRKLRRVLSGESRTR